MESPISDKGSEKSTKHQYMKLVDTLYRIFNKLIIYALVVVNWFFKQQNKVYMIHHVNANKSLYSISKDNLDKFLAIMGNKVIPIEQIFSKNRAIALTIDDVSEDFYLNGYPLFLKHKIPFTIFVCTDLIDKDGYITINQLLDMISSPLCTLGSHGAMHAYYRNMGTPKRDYFFKASKHQLEKITNKSVDYFAFPYGSFYACGFKRLSDVKKYYKLGFSTIPISISKHIRLPQYFLPRINLTNDLCKKLIDE